MENYSETYIREVHDNIEELEAALLEMESAADKQELINLVFRKYHTIKGSGSMFGFDAISDFTHEVETVYDLVRDGKIPVTKKLVDLSLLACDMIKRLVDGEETEKHEISELVSQFSAMIPDSVSRPHPNSQIQSYDETDLTEIACDYSGVVSYFIRFKPHEHLYLNGTNPIFLLNELRNLGECTIVVNPREIPSLQELVPTNCYLSWDVILTCAEDINTIKDVFIFVEDSCDLSIKILDDRSYFQDEGSQKKLGEILTERGDLSIDELENVLSSKKRLGEILVENHIVEEQEVISALKEQEHFARIKKKNQETASASIIRVPADRLDSLVDLVGELVTIQARLSEEVKVHNDANLVYIAEEIERLTGELRDKTMNIRMLPIETLFSKFKRVVRDLSEELGKQVRIETEGGETELDKRVIEQLNDPLVHLIRNSIDHGIETPEKRKGTGKPAEGILRLKATHSGDNVLITIEDDGTGLDTEKIRNKAVEKGLISKETQLTEEELFMQIFSPGFSTATKITGVSGRGVGMDVVKKSVDALQGSVSVASKKKMGTKIMLKVPLTLAIVDGLMVKVGEGDYVFPLSAVEECVEVTRKEADRAKKRKMVELRGKMVRYMSLSDYFNTENSHTSYEKIVIVDSNGKKIGIGVDSVVGKMQTVVKSIGDIYKDVKGLSGATIKGDGTIALVLDVNTLSRSISQSAESNQIEKIIMS